MKRPLPRYQQSVCAFVVNDDDISDSEAQWIRRSDDLGTLCQDVEHGWLNGFVEDVIAKISRTLYLVSVFSLRRLALAQSNNPSENSGRCPCWR